MKLFLFAFLYVAVGVSTSAKAQSQSMPNQSQPETAGSSERYLKIIDLLQLDDMRAAMLGVGNDGLNPRRYWTEDMEWYYQQGIMNQGLKQKANENFLKLLQDISLGVVDPALVGRDVKMQRKSFIPAKQLQVRMLATGSKATPLLWAVSPQSPQYVGLKKSLQKIAAKCTQQEWTPLTPLAKTLRLGSIDAAVREIKTRLALYGYPVTNVDDNYDDEMLGAINDIQWLLRVTPDGLIVPNGKTWNYLNTSCLDRMRQIRADMEKLRWFQQTYEDRYIFVNLAMTYFTLVDRTAGPTYTMSFRTINGRAARPTPTMKDRVTTVIINPYWVVPPTIFREDKIEELRNLSKEQVAEYFTSHNYEVWNSSFSQQIDPVTIDWKNLDPNADRSLFIRQKPFLGNALGVLKFLLTNSFAIYLHDTNQRELFESGQRLLSSGCVRLQRPLDLAEYLLKGTAWDRARVEDAMAKPGEVMAGETKIPLTKSVPLYLVFLTSQMSSDGVIRFVEDLYGQNRRLLLKGVW